MDAFLYFTGGIHFIFWKKVALFVNGIWLRKIATPGHAGNQMQPSNAVVTKISNHTPEKQCLVTAS